MPGIALVRRHGERSLPVGQSITGGQLVVGAVGPVTRNVTDGVTTANSTAITSATANFQQADVGDAISGGSIPAGATIAAVTSANAATLSLAATATATAVAFSITVPTNPDAQNTDIAYVAGANATNVMGVAMFDAIPFSQIPANAAWPQADRVTLGLNGEFPVTFASAASVGQWLVAAANGQVAPYIAGTSTFDQIVGICTQSTAAGAVGTAYIGRS